MAIITAQYTGKCYKCSGGIGVGDRIVYDRGLRASAHLDCVKCAKCGKVSDEVCDHACRDCVVKAYKASPEGQAEAKAIRSTGAAKAAQTRKENKRLRECQHVNATTTRVGGGSGPELDRQDCPDCGKRRFLRLDGSVYSWVEGYAGNGWDLLP